MNDEVLVGVVNNITYYSKKDDFSIIKLRTEKDIITCIGYLPFIVEGLILKIRGKWEYTRKFGKQFSIISYIEELPTDKQDIKKYLCSKAFFGIGTKFAEKIVNIFKEESLNIIFNDLHRLNEIKDFGEKRIELLDKSCKQISYKKDIVQFFNKHLLNLNMVVKAFELYGENFIETIEKNPYQLVDDIEGVGFVSIDKVAFSLGIDKESYIRCRMAVLYTLHKSSNQGHCYESIDDLVNKGSSMLEIAPEKLYMTINEMKRVGEIICEDNYIRIYLPALYYSEVGVSKRIKQILKTSRTKQITNTKIKSCFKYDEIQLKSIDLAIKSKITVITGGAGTGKTTTVIGIIELFKQNGFKILLAAPTGKAAKRMTEVTGIEAKTIHRLLESDSKKYSRNEKYQLHGDVLIVDECSMIDVVLMHNLLKAISNHMTLILVGDTNQLPSIKAGNVLLDIIESEAVPVIKLKKIYRQAEKSNIIRFSKTINNGHIPSFENENDSDFFFIEENDEDKILQKVLDLVCNRLPKKYKEEMQVITPMKKTHIGANNLNNKLQSLMNKSKHYIRCKNTVFKVKDKVMQVKNNYDKNIFNGDTGIIEEIDINNKKLIVNFDKTKIEYIEEELEELTLAYAITIHKSQGSEYPIVVMPISMVHNSMLQRKLLYTGVTRARKLLIIVGDKNALTKGIKRNDLFKRNTYLKNRLNI